MSDEHFSVDGTADPGLGEPQIVPAQAGRERRTSGRAACQSHSARPQRRARLARAEAEQRDAPQHHRPRRPACPQVGRAIEHPRLCRACADGEPFRPGGAQLFGRMPPARPSATPACCWWTGSHRTGGSRLERTRVMTPQASWAGWRARRVDAAHRRRWTGQQAWQGPCDHHRRSHHPPPRLRPQPAGAQADRGGVWLDEGFRRTAPTQAPRPRAGRLALRSDGDRLQPRPLTQIAGRSGRVTGAEGLPRLADDAGPPQTHRPRNQPNAQTGRKIVGHALSSAAC